jgi:hypothetical protein
MRLFQAPRAAVLVTSGFLFSTLLTPVHAAIVLGIITFDDHPAATELAPGPYEEAVAGVDVRVTSPAHIHIGDWSGDGSPDLYNHANITQTLTFSQPVDILGFDVVDETSGLGNNNVFISSAGGSFNISALGFFDVTTSGDGIWEGITSFSWTQPGGDLTIDNLRFSTVPVPAAFWFGLSGIGTLSRIARRRKITTDPTVST